MPYSLKNRNVLVTGASRGLGALICEKFAAEGCNVAINYVSSKDKANEVAELCHRKFGVKAVVIQADVGIPSQTTQLVREAVKQLGGLDIVINNASWTRFANFRNINDLSLDEWNRCWSTNTLSHLVIMQEIAPIFNANPDGGVFLITSSISGVNTGGSSLGYSVTKAAGLHLMKCLAITQGPRIRINAILPGLLLTDWGRQFSNDQIKAWTNATALKQEVSLDDCADAFVSTAKNASMTGQQIVVGRLTRTTFSPLLIPKDSGTLIR